MTALTLPALDGRTPLAFLAGLGVLRLITEHADNTARLAWSPADCTAVLHSNFANLDELAAALRKIAESIPDDGVLPGLPPDFPPPGEAPDKLRLSRPDHRLYAANTWEQMGPDGERWLASLVTDLVLDKAGRASISLYGAPSGKQSMRTMLEKPLAAIQKNPAVLLEALSGWRRQAGVTGEYLDHRVLFDAAAAPDGESRERGVPGATWLALMSYPLLRTTAPPGGTLTTGWQRVKNVNGRSRQLRMIYPLWSAPLSAPMVSAVLSHPVLAEATPGDPPRSARLLTVFTVCAAQRRQIPGRTFAGVLAPVPPEPPRDAARRRGADRAHPNFVP